MTSYQVGAGVVIGIMSGLVFLAATTSGSKTTVESVEVENKSVVIEKTPIATTVTTVEDLPVVIEPEVIPKWLDSISSVWNNPKSIKRIRSGDNIGGEVCFDYKISDNTIKLIWSGPNNKNSFTYCQHKDGEPKRLLVFYSYKLTPESFGKVESKKLEPGYGTMPGLHYYTIKSGPLSGYILREYKECEYMSEWRRDQNCNYENNSVQNWVEYTIQPNF